MKTHKVFYLVAVTMVALVTPPSATSGRYDGMVGLGKRFNHASDPPRWTQIDNSLGGKTTITNKPTSDPNYPGQRFENFKMTDGNGNTVGKDTFIYDHNGNINAIK